MAHVSIHRLCPIPSGTLPMVAPQVILGDEALTAAPVSTRRQAIDLGNGQNRSKSAVQRFHRAALAEHWQFEWPTKFPLWPSGMGVEYWIGVSSSARLKRCFQEWDAASAQPSDRHFAISSA